MRYSWKRCTGHSECSPQCFLSTVCQQGTQATSKIVKGGVLLEDATKELQGGVCGEKAEPGRPMVLINACRMDSEEERLRLKLCLVKEELEAVEIKLGGVLFLCFVDYAHVIGHSLWYNKLDIT